MNAMIISSHSVIKKASLPIEKSQNFSSPISEKLEKEFGIHYFLYSNRASNSGVGEKVLGIKSPLLKSNRKFDLNVTTSEIATVVAKLQLN